LFQFGATALSTNNANDYAVTPGAATFTNNSDGSGVVLSTASVANGATRDLIALSPPTPNPVRNSMAYNVTLSREAGVQVRVLDVDGRVVRKLVDETMPAGQHSFTWRESNRTGSALPDGLYFLEMNAEGARSIQRFALIH
jgi:flagellar hook assembly protein FlgD